MYQYHLEMAMIIKDLCLPVCVACSNRQTYSLRLSVFWQAFRPGRRFFPPFLKLTIIPVCAISIIRGLLTSVIQILIISPALRVVT